MRDKPIAYKPYALLLTSAFISYNYLTCYVILATFN